jgi:hypothetical protein
MTSSTSSSPSSGASTRRRAVAVCRRSVFVAYLPAVRLGQFTFGYVVSVGIAAVVFILALKWAGARFPKVPVVGAVARAI